MIRRAFGLVGPLALLFVMLWAGSLMGVGYVVGYGLLCWVLVRAAPGCWADLRALVSFGAAVVPSRVDLRRSPNNGF